MDRPVHMLDVPKGVQIAPVAIPGVQGLTLFDRVSEGRVYFKVVTEYSMRPHSAYAALILIPLSACAMPLDLTAHMTEGDVSFQGYLTRQTNSSGYMKFAAPHGPTCDGFIVAAVVSTPERAEGQMQCDDGRSGAFRMFFSPTVGVGSGRLGRDTITFRAVMPKSEEVSQADAAPVMPIGDVTLEELMKEALKDGERLTQ